MTESQRSLLWLRERADCLWKAHFSDVPIGYPLQVSWGIRAHHRFGSISARDEKAVVRLNVLFAFPEVPEYVIDAVLVHEFVHYAHGFGSGLPKRYRHPHRGGVIEKELALRGLLAQDVRADEWLKTCWEEVYRQYRPDLVAKQENTQTRFTPVLPTNGRTLQEIETRLNVLAFRLGSEPYALGWLSATRRHRGMSYFFLKEKTVQLHPLLADKKVPDCVIDLELAYWLTRFQIGANWQKIALRLSETGFQKTLDDALAYKRNRWTRLLKTQ